MEYKLPSSLPLPKVRGESQTEVCATSLFHIGDANHRLVQHRNFG
ncbi:MAG: hypothetical protein QOI77_2233 [Blastocatellia bacterium]|nr:hypothetical protein [Blastocatellia bacterium]